MRMRIPGVAGMVAAAALFASFGTSTALAAPTVNGVFNLSGKPGEITTGPDGNVWTTLNDSGASKSLARITPGGTVTEFAPAKLNNPVGITAGPDGNLWLTQSMAVVRVPPADPDSAEDFAVAALAQARGITAGPDGNLWAASNDKLLKIPPADPTTFEEFPIAGMGARGIDSGGGRLWIADFNGRIISATTAGVATPVDVGGGPQEVAAGPGNQAAYGNPGADPQNVGRLEPGGSPLLTATPMADPFGIDLGADGAYWIAQFAAGNLGRLTPAGAYTTLGGLPAASGPRYLTAAPGNTVWVGLENSKQVARISGVDPPSPPPPPPPPPNPPDTTAPNLQLEGKRNQSSTKRLLVKATSDEDAAVVISQVGKKATVKGGRATSSAKKKLKLKAMKKGLKADQSKLFKLRFTGKKTRKSVRRLLKRGKKITFALAGKATDTAGNKGKDRLKVTLRKPR